MRRRDWGVRWARSPWLLPVALAVVLTGCGTVSLDLKAEPATTDGARVASADASDQAAPVAAPTPAADVEPTVTAAGPAVAPSTVPEPSTAPDTTLDVNFGPRPSEPVEAADGAEPTRVALLSGRDDVAVGFVLAQAAEEPTDVGEEQYDPWEPFNEKMFEFNRNLDRFVLKPVARGYMFIMPEPWQVLIANGFDNISFVPRFVNSLLQGKWGGAGRELARFLINSTAGIGGVFDPAKDFWGIQKSREDFGQTLGVWGSGPGPYVIVPFLEPLTVRDGIGKAVDGFMDPLSYVLPFFWARFGMKIGDIVNERALNYDLFQGFEESVIDMYSAVRHGYLQRRKQLIKE